MKKFKVKRSIILFAIYIVTCCCACTKEETSTAIDISYLNTAETKLVTETHYLKGDTAKEMIVEVLKLLCVSPDNKELKATIASNMNIINYAYDSGQVTVSVGEKYKELPKTTEVLTRAAIVRSLTAIPEVNYVAITVNGEPLTDGNGVAVGIMTADMFVDNTATQQPDKVDKFMIKLYFANESGDGLIEINREISHNPNISNVSMEKLVLEQLIMGPANAESYPTINPNTKILNVTVKDRVCHISFDKEFLTAVNNVTSDVTIYSIVNSLAELSNINKVQISIDGSSEIKFRDKYELTTIFERNLSIVE